jgi:hypothetical protein
LKSRILGGDGGACAVKVAGPTLMKAAYVRRIKHEFPCNMFYIEK